MIELIITLCIAGAGIIISLALALLRGAVSWLGAFFHRPLTVLLSTIIVIALLGTAFGVLEHVLAYKDTKHGGWTVAVEQMWQSAHGHGPIDQGSAWFYLVCMFVCPAVLLVFGLILLIAAIVNAAAARKNADTEEQPLRPYSDQDADAVDVPYRYTADGRRYVDAIELQPQIDRILSFIREYRNRPDCPSEAINLLDAYEYYLTHGSAVEEYTTAMVFYNTVLKDIGF